MLVSERKKIAVLQQNQKQRAAEVNNWHEATKGLRFDISPNGNPAQRNVNEIKGHISWLLDGKNSICSFTSLPLKETCKKGPQLEVWIADILKEEWRVWLQQLVQVSFLLKHSKQGRHFCIRLWISDTKSRKSTSYDPEFQTQLESYNQDLLKHFGVCFKLQLKERVTQASGIRIKVKRKRKTKVISTKRLKSQSLSFQFEREDADAEVEVEVEEEEEVMYYPQVQTYVLCLHEK